MTTFPRDFLSLKVVCTEPAVIHQLQFGFSCPYTDSQDDFHSWVIAEVNYYSPYLYVILSNLVDSTLPCFLTSLAFLLNPLYNFSCVTLLLIFRSSFWFIKCLLFCLQLFCSYCSCFIYVHSPQLTLSWGCLLYILKSISSPQIVQFCLFPPLSSPFSLYFLCLFIHSFFSLSGMSFYVQWSLLSEHM